MESSEVILPLIVALWACVNVFHNVAKELNDKRDRILSGHIGESRISKTHRLVLLHNDWLSHSAVATFVSFGFGTIAFLIPFIVSDSETRWAVWAVCSVVGIFGLASGGCWVYYGIKEYRLMKVHIDSETDTRFKEGNSNQDEPCGAPEHASQPI